MSKKIKSKYWKKVAETLEGMGLPESEVTKGVKLLKKKQKKLKGAKMRKVWSNNGFTLLEILFAMGTLAVAMLFIAGTFAVALYFSMTATERTIGAVVADEAFAKIRLYADGNPNDSSDDIKIKGYLEINQQTRFNNGIVFPATSGIDLDEFAYPSDPCIPISEKKYYWSALCRLAESETRLVQVTVFVSRKVGEGSKYWGRKSDRTLDPVGSSYPIPIDVNISEVGPDELSINFVDPVEKTFINDGYTIVDDRTGQIYRVLERYAAPKDNRIQLDRPWRGSGAGSVWVVPPPVNGGRYPCIAVYQKVIRF